MTASIQLNPEQHQAVTEAGHCLVVACPGSGKTRLLVSKAEHLLQQDAAARIVAVTFTRDSALELKARVVEAVGEAQAKRVLVGTFHSLCLQQLKLSGRTFSLVSPAEQLEYVRRAWEMTGQEVELEEAQRLIEKCKTDLGYQMQDDPAGRLIDAYARLLQRNQAADFQDLIGDAVRGMQDGSVAPIPGTHLFVDEFQDTDASQYAWLRAHSVAGLTVTVVGDDDQCQPASTQVLTTAGYKRIDRLHPGQDTLLAWNGEQLVAAAAFARAVRTYTGALVEVKAGSRTTRCTPDHRWQVRWHARAKAAAAVYLVRRGELYRIEARRLVWDDGIFHYDHRPEVDAAWVITVCPSYQAALDQEAQLALAYQLPLTFLHASVLRKRLHTLCQGFSLSLDLPGWQRGLPLHGMFQVRAANLLSGCMQVPVVADDGRTAWRTVHTRQLPAVVQPVYSLAVEPQHTYVADGLATCNCIYSWRHAMGYEGMLRFEQEHRARRVILGANYRCRREILESAGRVIAYNAERLDKTLVAWKGTGGQVAYRRYPSRDIEADTLSREVAGEPERWAVLSRTNHLLNTVEAFLSVRKIPYYRSADNSLWDRTSVSFMLSLLRSLCQERDRGRIDQLLHWAGVPEDELGRLHQVYGDRLNALPTRLSVTIAPASAQILHSFSNMYAGWKNGVHSERVDLVILGVAQWMMARAPDKLTQNELEIAANALMRLNGSLSQRIAWVLRREEANSDAPRGVALLTLHSSKGLEFDRVWIIGAEETVLPSEKSLLEEERRLMYVGMTRAREHLVISSTDENPTSRFVHEGQLDT